MALTRKQVKFLFASGVFKHIKSVTSGRVAHSSAGKITVHKVKVHKPKKPKKAKKFVSPKLHIGKLGRAIIKSHD